MNKYELALVVSAKLEDEARDAVVEKAKGYITRYNGVIMDNVLRYLVVKKEA